MTEVLTKEVLWNFDFQVADDSHEVLWILHKRVTDGYGEPFLHVKINGEEITRDHAGDLKSEQAIASARAFVITKLRQELSDSPIFDPIELKAWHKKTILELFERASNFEWIGQENGNRVYVQLLDEILKLKSYDVVKELIDEKKIGLYGNILIPYEAYADGVEANRLATGHEKIIFTDFGNWGCEACNQSGFAEDEKGPEGYPCVK